MLFNKIVGTVLFLGTNIATAAEPYYGPFNPAYNPVYGTPDHIQNPFTAQDRPSHFNFDDVIEALSHYEYPASIHFGHVAHEGLARACNDSMVMIFQNLPYNLRNLRTTNANQQKWEWLINAIYNEAKLIERGSGIDHGRLFLLHAANSFRHCQLHDAYGTVIPPKHDKTGYALYPSLLELSRCIHEFMLVSPANDKELASFMSTRVHYNDFHS